MNLDPIDFRLKNALRSGMKNTQGAVPAGAIRVDDVLQKARVHPLWVNRAKRKAEFEAAHPGKRYGVGFACVQKDFGTGAETSFAKVELSADGTISLQHTAAEIGTGMSTSQAIAVAKWLGKPATDVHVAITEWPDLPVVTSGDPYTDVAGRPGQAGRQSALVAGLCVAVERDQLGVLLHAQHA